MLKKTNIGHQEKKLIIYIVLTIVTLAVYWQMTQFNFVNFDDTAYVTKNSHVQAGISLNGILWAFRTTYAEFWHPLTWLSLMFDYELYGLNAGGYHATNVFLHILSALLLFWLFHRMTGALWPSAFVAAFFALHPLHVESVAWIAERKDVLSAFFWMLTLCLYVYYVEKPDIKRYLLVLFSFICGLMSKPMVVTLPVIMILLDYWPLGRFKSQKENPISWQLKEKIPFFVLSAVFSIITLYAQSFGKHFPWNSMMASEFFYFANHLDSRIANALVYFVTYLKNIFWPCNLAAFYPFPDKFPALQLLGAALLVIAMSAIVIATVKRLPFLFVGWLWFSIAILPVIGIIRKGYFSVADHYIYLPSTGIAIMLAWGVPLLFPRENIRKKFLFPAVIFFLAAMAFLTWKQCGYWKNSFELFNHAALVTKDNYLAHTNRGNAFLLLGQYQNAIDDCNEAIRFKPDYAEAYYNRGFAYAKAGQYQQALEDLTEGIRLKPDEASTYCNRGNVYDKLGSYPQAIEDYNEAIRLKPDYAEAYYNRGNVYGKLGQYQQAVEDYNEGIHLRPKNAAAYYNNRGNAYFLQGNKESGCRDVQKACSLGMCKLFKFAKDKKVCR